MLQYSILSSNSNIFYLKICHVQKSSPRTFVQGCTTWYWHGTSQTVETCLLVEFLPVKIRTAIAKNVTHILMYLLISCSVMISEMVYSNDTAWSGDIKSLWCQCVYLKYHNGSATAKYSVVSLETAALTSMLLDHNGGHLAYIMHNTQACLNIHTPFHVIGVLPAKPKSMRTALKNSRWV